MSAKSSGRERETYAAANLSSKHSLGKSPNKVYEKRPGTGTVWCSYSTCWHFPWLQSLVLFAQCSDDKVKKKQQKRGLKLGGLWSLHKLRMKSIKTFMWRSALQRAYILNGLYFQRQHIRYINKIQSFNQTINIIIAYLSTTSCSCVLEFLILFWASTFSMSAVFSPLISKIMSPGCMSACSALLPPLTCETEEWAPIRCWWPQVLLSNLYGYFSSGKHARLHNLWPFGQSPSTNE